MKMTFKVLKHLLASWFQEKIFPEKIDLKINEIKCRASILVMSKEIYKFWN